jgi:integrase
MGEWKGVKLPRYVMLDKQRDGRPRWIFRRKGFPKATLPEPGSTKFWEAYAAAMHGMKPQKRSASVKPANDGTFGWLCDRYMESSEFTSNDEATQLDKKRNFQAMREEPIQPGSLLLMENCPLKSLNRSHVVMWRDRKKDVPSMANKRLVHLRVMFAWAIDEGLMETNPVDKVKPLKTKKGGWHTWTPEEVAQYEVKHPIGTKARLLFAQMLYTGFRISDATKLGSQHVKDGWIEKPQHKNRKRQGKVINVPMLAVLQAVIDATPDTGKEAFFATRVGNPYGIKSATIMFKEWCVEAGLAHCSSHGLRKAGAVNAAHNGATDSQMKAIFGWEGQKEVAIYTAKAERKKLAGQAMELILHKTGTEG